MKSMNAGKLTIFFGPGAILIVASALVSNDSAQLALGFLALFLTAILFGISYMRQQRRVSQQFANVYERLSQHREKQSQKEYRILQAILENNSDARALAKDVSSELQHHYSLLKALSEAQDAPADDESKEPLPRGGNTGSGDQHGSDEQKNRLALQQLLGRMLKAQEEILRRLDEQTIEQPIVRGRTGSRND